MYLQTDSFVIEDEELIIIKNALIEYQFKQTTLSDLWMKIDKILFEIGKIQEMDFH